MSSSTGSPSVDAREHDLLDLVAGSSRGVLVTLKRDGRPQLSNITYHYGVSTRVVRISVTADRAKTRNAVRDARVGLHVTSEDFWAWTVVEGSASLTPVASAPDDEAVQALVDLYRDVAGEHPDWDEYRRAMVADRRRVLSFTAQHVYGQLAG